MKIVKNCKDFYNIYNKRKNNSVILVYIFDNDNKDFSNELANILQKKILQGLVFIGIDINKSNDFVANLDITSTPSVRIYLSNNKFIDFSATDKSIIPIIDSHLESLF